MRKSQIELFVTTVLFSSSLARDDSWYVSLDGGVSEEEGRLPIGKVPDLPDQIVGYNFSDFDGNYDFPGFTLGTETHPISIDSQPSRQLKIDRLATDYRTRSHRSRGFWS